MGHNALEVAFIAGKGKAVDYSKVIRWVATIRSGRPKTVYLEAVLLIMEANLMSNTKRVSGELAILLFGAIHFHNVAKVSGDADLSL